MHMAYEVQHFEQQHVEIVNNRPNSMSSNSWILLGISN